MVDVAPAHNAWAPSSGLVTMTGDDEGPGAAHPQGRYP
jgi:hypothetical protein